MNPLKIEYNAGKRFVAKLCLNSFWGKFAQKSDVTKSSMIADPKDYFQLLTSDKEKVHNIIFLNDEIVEICHTTESDFQKTLPTNNLVIATFTTASARLKLMEALKVVKDRILYMDIDSLMYISMEGQPDPKEGNALGDLESELSDGDFIGEYVAGGAKNYGYKTEKGITQLKVRGFTLNALAQKTLNFGSVKGLVSTGDPHKSLKVMMGTTIKRDPKTKKLYTVQNKKDYKVFDKRVFLMEGRTSVPFGFVSEQ